MTEEAVIKFKALTVYNYYDGATQFSGQSTEDESDIYMFRWVDIPADPDDAIGRRTYKADGYDIITNEKEVDWSEAVI